MKGQRLLRRGEIMVTGREKLRIGDLKQRHPGSTRLMNVKIPTEVAEAIEQLAKGLGTSKTEVVLALLNEGLAVAQEKVGKR
jgi:hypothetical protein